MSNFQVRSSCSAPYRASDSIDAKPLRPWYLSLKFIAEWVAAFMLLLPSAVLMSFLALLVKVTSRGPAFYSQKRVGMNGRIFTMYKLRSMVADCEAATGPVWSQPGDKRVTYVGRILRDTHLDELPQLWNVLRGEMSLIGPRPERPEIVAHLETIIPHYCDRLAVRPGLTGLAQVELPPDSSENTVKKKLAYDRYYVINVGPLLDLRVALSTAMYFLGSAANAVCHGLVRSYGREIERTLDAPFLEERSAQTA